MCEPYNTHWCHGAHLWWEWVAPKDPEQLANITAWRRPYRSRGRPMLATAPDGAVPLDAPLDIEAYPDEYVWCATAKRPLPCCWIAWPSSLFGGRGGFSPAGQRTHEYDRYLCPLTGGQR